MPEGKEYQLLIAALRDVVAWLEAANARGVIIGGVAASLLGRPRLTRDIDTVIMLDVDEWSVLLEVGTRFGVVPRLSDVLEFARQSRVLLMRHAPTGIDVDVVIGGLPFEEETIARRHTLSIGDVALPLPSPEDLVVMKAVAHRPRDLADIEGILATQTNLDLRRVRRWVREFAEALEQPEIIDDLEAVIARHRRRPRRR